MGCGQGHEMLGDAKEEGLTKPDMEKFNVFGRQMGCHQGFLRKGPLLRLIHSIYLSPPRLL